MRRLTAGAHAGMVSLLSVALCVASTSVFAGDHLEKSLSQLIDAPEFKHAHWGVLVADLETGNILYERNADKLFAPASTTKLFSVAAALDSLGADYCFETPVYARGEVVDGTLRGDLILIASGDPTFGGRTDAAGHVVFANTDHTYAGFSSDAAITASDPLAGLRQLAKQTRASGIKEIEGDVLIDDRLFDRAEGTGSGPRRITPIMINDNVIDVIVTPAESAGQPAKVDWRPKCSVLVVDAQVESVEMGKPPQVNITGSGFHIAVRGQIPLGHKPLLNIVEATDPAGWARALWIDALRAEGIRTGGSAIEPQAADRLPPRDHYRMLKAVAKFVSPPFREHARLILKVSHNLHASTLPLLLAVHHGKRTLRDGLRLEGDFLRRAGVDAESISFGGGAGGDRADYVTPRSTVQLLRYMATRPDFNDYREALPVMGADGTLVDTTDSNSPVAGKVQAKTGTLVWHDALNDRQLLASKALAGYETTASGRTIVFAVFVNLVHLSKQPEDRQRIGQVLGRICEVLHEKL